MMGNLKIVLRAEARQLACLLFAAVNMARMTPKRIDDTKWMVRCLSLVATPNRSHWRCKPKGAIPSTKVKVAYSPGNIWAALIISSWNRFRCHCLLLLRARLTITLIDVRPAINFMCESGACRAQPGAEKDSRG